MKPKHKLITLNFFRANILALVAIVAAATVGILQHDRTQASPPAKPAVGAAVPSKFSFTGASGWWQGATNKTSMALFHNYDCFTSVQYYSGTVDAATELQKLSASQSGASDGGTSTPGAVVAAALQTTAGKQQYQLHQYMLTNPGMKLMQGFELGYLQLSGSYIKIEGHCDTADELPSTLPALQAIKFDETK